MLDTIYNVIFPILLAVGIGMIYGRLLKPDPKAISSAIIYVFAPFLVIEGFATADLPPDDLLRIGALVVITALIMSGIGLGVARLLGLDKRTASAFVLSVVLFNGANYGLPFNTFAFGMEAEQLTVITYSVSAVVVNTLGVYMAARGTQANQLGAVLNIFRVPLLYATLIGLILNLTGIGFSQESGGTGATIPLPLARTIDVLSDAAVPAMLVLLGLQLNGVRLNVQRVGPMLAAAGLKLIAMPAVAVGLGLLLGLDGLALKVGIVQHGMPTAVIAGALATQFDGDAELVTGALLISTLGSVLTLSLLVELIG